jgi:opacity protein-like surface antigen
MKKLLAVAVAVLSCAAFAQAPAAGSSDMKDQKAQGQMAGHDMGKGQMGGWMPQTVTKKDTKGIETMMKAWHEAFMKKDIAGAAQNLDFPVLMVTTDSKGNVMTTSWDHDTWVNNMTKSMASMPDMKDMPKMPMPKMKYDFITNGIASVFETMTMPMGKKSMTTNSHCLVVMKDGKWLVKSMTEGGWGDMMGDQGMKKDEGMKK